MKYYGRVAKAGVFWGVVRDGLIEVMHIPTAIILARLLSPREFGIVATAYFFMQLAERLTSLGFSAGLLRMKDLRPDHVSSVFVVDFLMCACAWAALIIGAQWVGAFFNTPEIAMVLPLAGVKFVVSAFGTVPQAMLSRELEYRKRTATDFIGAIALSLSSIGFAWAGYGYWSLIYGDLLKAFVRNGLLVYFSGWVPRFRVSRAALSEMMSFGIGVYAKLLFTYFARNLDNLVVGRMLGMTALGLYDKAFNLMGRFVARIALSGPGVSYRVFAMIHEDQERFRRAYRKVTMTVTLIGYPIFAAAIVMAPELFVVVFGPQWAAAASPFRLLAVAGAFKLLTSFTSSASQAKGWIWWEVWIQAIYAALVVVAVVVLSPWGLVGAAAGVLAATAVMFVLMLDLARRSTGLEWRDLLLPQVPGCVSCLGVVPLLLITGWFVRRVVSEPSPWQLVLTQSVVGAIFYVSLLWFSPFREVRSLVHETLSEYSPRLAAWMVAPSPPEVAQ